ncbi:hypothetical protein ZWY2020_043411 [Hordeum vulgare]|nr:hypothetical protein ZWY2020_043411 [Hordeum vulgare]
MARRSGCSVGAALLALAALLAASAVPGAAGFHLGGDEATSCGHARRRPRAGRGRDAARFAVAEHNRKQGSALEFTRVVDAKRQVVAGTLHDLMVEVVDSGKKSMYKAKVWVKPWQNFKAVVEFRHAGDFQSESSVASDGSTGQAILKLSLQTDMAPKMHSNDNTGLSVDSSSSQAHKA